MSGGKVSELVLATGRLVDLIEQEIELLRAGKVRAIQPLQAEKNRLADEYEARLEQLRADPALFAAVAPAMRQELLQATQRLRTEESSRRVEPLLATGTSRIGWALSHVLFTVLGTAALMVAFGLCFGLVDGAREGTLGHTVGADLMAALVQLPAAWVLGALAVTLFGLWPRLTGLGWAAVAIAVVLTDLGTELRLPQLVMDISPYTHLPKLPGGTVTSTPLLWLLAVTVLLLVVGLIGFRRRDIDTP